jgi:anti-sigma factor RsiW
LPEHCLEEQLSSYLDGDLPPGESGRVAEHLAECPVCRRALAHVRLIRDAGQSMEEFVPPDRTWQAIRARVHERRPSLWPRLVWVGVPALAVVVLAVLAIGRLPAIFGRSRPVAASPVSNEELVREAVRDYEQYVRGIDSAVVECAAALGENPGNARVRESYHGASADRSVALDQLVSGGD